MDLDAIHKRVNFFINKVKGRYYAPAQLDDVLDAGSMAVFSTFFNPEVKSQPIHAALDPFRVRWQYLQSDFTGNILNLPAACLYPITLEARSYSNVTQSSTDEQVTIYKSDEWSLAKKSQVRKPTVIQPIGLQVGNTIEFYPTGSYNGTMHYLRRPVRPNYVFTQPGRDPIYNPTASTQLEWADPYVGLVILKALSLIGININDKELQSYADQKAGQSITSPIKE